MFAWLQQKEGWDGALKLFEGQDWSITVDDGRKSTIGRRWEIDLRLGTIPNDLMEFYALMDKHPTYSLMGIRNLLYKK